LFIIIIYFINTYSNIFNQFSKDQDILKINKVNKILNNIKKISTVKDNFLIDDVYPINKTPKTFLFIKNNLFIMDIIFELKFLESFNKEQYYRIIILLEYFLKYYYKTITGEYEYDKVIEMLMAIRRNILNSLVEQTYSIPINLNLPDTKYDINDTDIYINKIVKKLQAYTYRKIKILGNKNKNQNHILYKLPKEYNLFKNKYQLY
jgi:hypothetical protein